MVRKNAKRFLSIILSVLLVSSFFTMNISAAEENVASIGDVYYNSVEDALEAAVSGDKVIVQKDTTITRDVTVPAGVTLLVPHKDGYTGYDLASGTPDLSEQAKNVTDVLYRTLTVASGVTVTVNGNVHVSAILGVTKGGSYRQEPNGNYAQITLNGTMNINNGGVIAADGYIKGEGTIEAFSGAEVRDLFVIEHWRGGTMATYASGKKVWPANEYDSHNIQVKVIVRYGAKYTGMVISRVNSAYDCTKIIFAASSGAFLNIAEGGCFVKTYEYRERIKGYVDVVKIYGGGVFGSMSIKLEGVTFNTQTYVMPIDGDFEIHLNSGDYVTCIDNLYATNFKFLPGSQLVIDNGAKLTVYKSSTLVFYKELLDDQFAASYRYPQGRPAAEMIVKNGGMLSIDGKFGGQVILEDGAIVKKSSSATFGVTTKEMAKMFGTSFSDALNRNKTISYTNAESFAAADGCHLIGWDSNNQMTAEQHSYAGEITDSTATCTTAGTGRQKCYLDGCEVYASVTVPATGHSYKSVVTAPTCTSEGYTTYTCSVCSDTYVSNKVPATGHNYNKSVVTAPTCTSDGYTTYTCADCGNTYQSDAVDALGHKEETIPGKAATCTEKGLTAGVRCSVCGVILTEQQEIPATGHTYGDWVITKEATCTEPGSQTKECSCGHKVTEAINAKGHKEEAIPAVDPECKKVGYTEGKKCTVCGTVTEEPQEVEALGHSYGAVVTPPTCTAGGYTTYTCVRCSDSYTDNLTDQLDHNYQLIDSVQSSCTEKGSETYKCSACEDLKTEELPLAEHTPGAEIVENLTESTCTGTGTYDKVTYCTVCKVETSREKVVTDPLGHTAGEAVIENNVDPDCENDGSFDTVVYCTVCDAELSRVETIVPKKGHSPQNAVEENRKASTCTEAGSYDLAVYCSVCSAELDRKTITIEKIAHTVARTEEENRTESTCKEAGSYEKAEYCSCGAELNRTKVDLELAKHTAGEAVVENQNDATCTEDGSYDNVTYCTICEEELERETITVAKPGHDMSDWTITKDADCTNAGEKYRECSRCDHFETKTITELGHTEVIDKAVEATCTSTGLTEGSHCEICGEVIVKQEEVKVLGHNYSDWTETKAPTLTTKGEKRRDCSRCDAFETEEIAEITLKANRFETEIRDENTLVFNAWTNAHNIAFYTTTATNSAVEVVTEGTPVGMTSSGDRYVLYYTDWVKAGSDVETTMTVDGKEYRVIFNFTDRDLEAKDILVLQEDTKVYVNNEDKVVTIVAYGDATEIEFNEKSARYDEFDYSEITNENITYKEKPEGRSYGSYVVKAGDADVVETTMTVNIARYCEEEYTLRVYFGTNPIEGVIEKLNNEDLGILIRNTASFDTDGKLRITRNSSYGPGYGSGIYMNKKGVTVEISNESGTFDSSRKDAYITYLEDNSSDVTGYIVIKDADGSTLYSGDVIFDLGLGNAPETPEEPTFDVIKELDIIRGTASIVDGKVVVTRNSGLAYGDGSGLKKLTKSKYTVEFVGATGTFINRSDAYITYIPDNTFDVEGTIIVRDAEGKELYNGAIIFDLGLGKAPEEPENPTFDVIKELDIIRGSASIVDGKVVVTRRSDLAEGDGSGLKKLTKSKYTVELVDATGVYTDRSDAYVTYIPYNTTNVEGKIIVTVSETEVYEYDIIFNLGY